MYRQTLRRNKGLAKKFRPSKRNKKLIKIWREAWEDGIWLQIFAADNGRYLAAAGKVKDLRRLGIKGEEWALRSIKANKLKLADCVALGAYPGNGKTPQEACRKAMLGLREPDTN